MNNVIPFHPPKSELILLYEVVDESGNAEWGGNSEKEALAWIATSPTAVAGHRLLAHAEEHHLPDL